MSSGAHYIAIVGENKDGHDYIIDAIKNGAKYIHYNANQSDKIAGIQVKHQEVEFIRTDDTTVEFGKIAAEHLENLRALGKGLKVIAVTGSVGKTTTKDAIGQILGKLYGEGKVVFPQKSFNNEIGVPLTILRAKASTQFLILEIGANHEGEISYLTSLTKPDVAVLLKAGVAHMGEFNGKDVITFEKTQIFNQSPQFGIINADDANSDELFALSKKVAPNTQFTKLTTKEILRISSDGEPLHFNYNGTEFKTNYLGVHNLYNLVAAFEAIQSIFDDFGGELLRQIAKIMPEIHPIAEHRLQIIKSNNHKNLTIIDDSYNANPDSMKAALDELAKQGTIYANLADVKDSGTFKTIAILGDMLELGEYANDAHQEIAEYALDIAKVDKVLAVGEYTNYYKHLDNTKNNKIEHFNNLSELENYEFLRENVLYLVKASSANHLWDITDTIIGD